MDGARNIDFYGYWVSGRDRNLSWVKARDIEKIRVYALGVLPTYHRGNYEELVPIDQIKLIPETPRLPGARISHGDPSAKHAIDGKLETYWKAPLNKAHFVVDLGEVMKVHRYTLVDGHMFNFKETTAIKRYRISASMNNADWTPLEIPAANVANYQYNNPQKFVILDQPVVPTKARFIKLEILDLWEPLRRDGGNDTRSAIVRMFNLWADKLFPKTAAKGCVMRFEKF
jgi:hypothetical protein